MKQFFRITAALLAAAFLLALTGCGSSSSAPSFTWFVDTIPANLDPQVASAAPDVIACENLYSGLVRKKADGEIVPDLSESWTVSSDGRTYTFQIKDGLTYKAVKGASTDHTITAEDLCLHFAAYSSRRQIPLMPWSLPPLRTVLPCWLAQPMPARWAFRPPAR